MTKTGVIITSDDFTEINGEGQFRQISLNNVVGEGDWRISDNSNGVNVKDIKHYIDLMAEGMATAIQFLAAQGVDTEVNLLNGAKSRIDKSLFTPADVEIGEKKNENYNGRKIDL